MRIACVLLLVASCRIALDSDEAQVQTTPTCKSGSATVPTCAAVGPTLAAIQENVFDRNCTSSCHDGVTGEAGKLDLHPGKALASLVGAMSRLEPSRQLVVAGDPEASYLLVMIGKQAGPIRADVGLMPFGATAETVLCCEKLDAISDWIASGALP